MSEPEQPDYEGRWTYVEVWFPACEQSEDLAFKWSAWLTLQAESAGVEADVSGALYTDPPPWMVSEGEPQ